VSILRYFLFPFSILYGVITWVRNAFYDFKFLKSKEHPIKLIVVGNLSMGGTGKSPVTLYLSDLLIEHFKVAILSRGYGRKTKGYRQVDVNSLASDVGDEPLMFKSISGDKIQVAVCEDRNEGVEQIKVDFPKTDLVLLDDAFQHRKIKAGFSILLTTFDNPFFHDFVVPFGSLREFRNGVLRANVLLVTKCPVNISTNDKIYFQNNLEKYKKPVFYSRIKYGALSSFTFEVQTIKNVVIVAGIANPKGMIEHLSSIYRVESCIFSDHHQFTKTEIDEIHLKFDNFAGEEKAIVTTQKDFMRLKDNIEKWGLINYPWYVLPISIEIEKEQEFNKLISDYVGKN
jgi:tetraacyldisaccharide 4'-kinase